MLTRYSMVALTLAVALACASAGRPGTIYSVLLEVTRGSDGKVESISVDKVMETPSMRRVAVTIPDSVLDRKLNLLRDTWEPDPTQTVSYTYFFYDPATPNVDPDLSQ